jgi:hypothetical protein
LHLSFFCAHIARGNIHDECAQELLFYNETAGRERGMGVLAITFQPFDLGMRRSKVEIFTSLWNLELTLIIFIPLLILKCGPHAARHKTSLFYQLPKQ